MAITYTRAGLAAVIADDIARSDFTAEYLRSVMRYDPETGHFYWLIRAARRVRIGDRVGCLHPTGYWTICIRDRRYKAHRLVWLYVHGQWPGEEIDHKNGIPSDNRLCNLREASHGQNRANAKRQKNNTSGFKGVSFSRVMGKWQASLRKDRRLIPLGYFDTPEEAHGAYCRGAEISFGEFARAG